MSRAATATGTRRRHAIEVAAIARVLAIHQPRIPPALRRRVAERLLKDHGSEIRSRPRSKGRRMKAR